MAIKFAVETIFKSRDKQSANFNKMGKNAKRFGETTSKAFKKASSSAKRFNGITRGILQAGAIQKSLAGVSRGLASVTTDFLDFDNAITGASAKFKGLDLATKAGQKTLQDLRKTARLVGRDTEFNAAQAAGGLDFLALAGFNAQQAMKLLPGVANLATVAGLDLATATDIASDSLGAFGLMTSNTAQLQKNFTRIQDVMAKTTATSNTNLVDLFESIKKGAPAFTAAGQSLESFSALAGSMANSGVKGAESGTQLRNVMLRLAKPTKQSADLMSRLGVRTQDANGDFRDVIDILADFEKGLKGMGTQQKSAALATVFGARSVTGINILLKDGTKQLRSYRQSLIDSQGASEKMARIMRSSLINRLKSLGSALTEVGFQFFDAFADKGANAIEKLTGIVRKINLKPITDGIKTIWKNAKIMAERFREIGERTGLFDTIRTALTQLKPHFDTIVDIVKTFWNFMNDSGIIDLMAKQLSFFVKVASVLSKVFIKMWSIVKPVVQGMAKVLKPILSSVGQLLDAFGETLDKIGEVIDPTAQQKAVQNLAAKKRFGEAAALFKKGEGAPLPGISTIFEAGDISKALSKGFNLFIAGLEKDAGAKPGALREFFRKHSETRKIDLRKEGTLASGGIAGLIAGAVSRQPTTGQTPPRQPPNRVQVETNQRLQARVGVRFENAPEGTTAQQDQGQGAIPVDITGLGNTASLRGL